MPTTIHSTIIKGKQLGRELGFPTANLNPSNINISNLETGVYAGLIEIDGLSGEFKAAVSVGLNSTFDQSNFTIEAYILDFDQDIYGKKVKLQLITKIREMLKFESVEELIKQIKLDVEKVNIELQIS
jgi:riboflavin kinase/FMN adenylyltransferase